MEEEGWIERSPSEIDRRGTEGQADRSGEGTGGRGGLRLPHLALVRKLTFDVVGPTRMTALAEAMDEIGRTARDR